MMTISDGIESTTMLSTSASLSSDQTKNKMISQALLSYKSNRNIKFYFFRAKLPSLDPNLTLPPLIPSKIFHPI